LSVYDLEGLEKLKGNSRPSAKGNKERIQKRYLVAGICPSKAVAQVSKARKLSVLQISRNSSKFVKSSFLINFYFQNRSRGFLTKCC